MNNGNVGLETSGMSWADMVEEDLEQLQHPSSTDDSCDYESPTTDEPAAKDDNPPPRTWASLLGGSTKVRSPQPQEEPSLETGVDDKKEERNDTSNIGVSQWHAYAKTLQEEEAAEEAVRRAKAEAAGPMPLPSDAFVKSTYDSAPGNSEQVQGLAASRWANSPSTSSSSSSPRMGSYSSRSNNNYSNYNRSNDDSEGLGASRWASSSPSQHSRYGDDRGSSNQYGESSHYHNKPGRYNKFYGDRDRNFGGGGRDDSYGNSNGNGEGYKRYNHSGGSWNSYNDRTNASSSRYDSDTTGRRTNWRSADGNGSTWNDQGERTSRAWPRGEGIDNDYNRNDPGDRTSRAWPRGEVIGDDDKPDKKVAISGESLGSAASKWANFKDPTPQPTPKPVSTDTQPPSIDNGSNETVGTPNTSTPDSAPEETTSQVAMTITTTFAAMTTDVLSTNPVDDTAGSVGEISVSTTSNTTEPTWGESLTSAVTGAAAEESSWETTAAATAASTWGTSSATDTAAAAELEPSWGANQIEQSPAQPAVKITTWKDVIGAPIEDNNDPGLANQAWKIAAAEAPPRTRRSSLTPSATHSQGTHSSNIPLSIHDEVITATPSWSTANDDGNEPAAPTLSWTTTDATNHGSMRTNDVPAENVPASSWSTTDKTAQHDSSFSSHHTPATFDAQPQRSLSNQHVEEPVAANKWKAFASKEIERHPGVPQHLHTRPIQHTASQERRVHDGHHAFTPGASSTSPESSHQPQGHSWGNLQEKRMHS